ncbi:hypothetical protein KC19_11G041500 [Ceratodon purpureus]|uniref:Ribosomal RNA-processing protein 42 n=1 Tax=Ceratodon purpureus TaxID=3225 RepID=A0A8T0GC49_CERPU|nr:hypothetical protein KC19_11G041500 [Ceratodon purpureus]
MGALSAAEVSYIEGGIAQNLRSDGRGRLDFRNISIVTGVIPQASGSARCKVGGTDVMVSVKAELGSPPKGRPTHGGMMIKIECSPTAAPEFEGRGGEELSLELTRGLERSFLGGPNGSGAAIDLSSLRIVDGKTCWVLCIDGLVLSSDGNLLDALSIAIKAALTNTGLPKVEIVAGETGDEDPEFEVDDEESSQLDISNVPIIITLTKVGKHYFVDATAEEELQMKSAVSVAVNRKGVICGVTKRGGDGLDPSVIIDMISVAQQIALTYIPALDLQIAAAESVDPDS